MYRNPRSEVVRFLENRHADHYFVYNFCGEKERCYPVSVFADRVKCFPFEDHNVPTLYQLFVDCFLLMHAYAASVHTSPCSQNDPCDVPV